MSKKYINATLTNETIKKLLCLIITIILILTFSGCIADSSAEVNDASFVIVEQKLLNGYWYQIAYHRDTKVMYVLGQYNDFTVMLDVEGKPLLWEGN